jgi:3-hydroxyisobutyrate dehydrogenase
METLGFIGLGNMGSVLAANLAASRHTVVAHDAAGPGRQPAGVKYMETVAEIARAADVVVLSLPDGDASAQVARKTLDAPDRRVTDVVDTSTIGVRAAEAVGNRLAGAGIGYVDAPVSGGPAGARARTLAVMYAGSDEACERVEPVLAGLSERRFRVGNRPGLGQAMKLANNFLSATALAATSEAIAFGLSAGLDMPAMLEVLNASSGRNSATSDKFPNHVVDGNYDSGFSNVLMAKDMALYLETVEEQHGPSSIATAIAVTWALFAADEPGADFTRIFPYVHGT